METTVPHILVGKSRVRPLYMVVDKTSVPQESHVSSCPVWSHLTLVISPSYSTALNLQNNR